MLPFHQGYADEGETKIKAETLSDGTLSVIKETKITPNEARFEIITKQIGTVQFFCSAFFTAKMVRVRDGYDYIDSIWGGVASCAGGAVSNKRLRISQKYENASKWARAVLSWDLTGYGGALGSSYEFRLFVGNDTYSFNTIGGY